MAIKPATLATLLLFCASALLSAQTAGPAPIAPIASASADASALAPALTESATQDAAAAESAPAPTGNSSSFTLDEKGNPIFTQVVRWQSDPNALEYELELKNAEGKLLLDERSDASSKEVQLGPGRYSYRITTYDLLDNPAAQTDWTDLVIFKAEQPVISSVKPPSIYMDDLDTRITISGEKLLEEGKIKLIPRNGGRPQEGRVVERKEDAEIVIVFPDSAYEPGEYSIYFENPGGLFAKTEDPLVIRFQRPMDFCLSAGYAPFALLGNDWARSVWTNPLYPLEAVADVSLFFIKQHWGFIGLGGEAEWRRFYGGSSSAVFTSDFLLCGGDLLYKYRITRTLHAVARLGGGLAWSYHSFDYTGAAGPTTTSGDPYARAGLALQYFLPNKFFGELGADYDYLFLLGESLSGIAPRLSIGYQLF